MLSSRRIGEAPIWAKEAVILTVHRGLPRVPMHIVQPQAGQVLEAGHGG